MTSWSTMQAVAGELLCIIQDAREIRDMVMGNEKVRTEIECLINDITEITKMLQKNGSEHDGNGK